MVISHTLDGHRVPADRLWVETIPVGHKRLNVRLLNSLREINAVLYGAEVPPRSTVRDAAGRIELYGDPPHCRVPFLGQRFLGVR